MWRGTAVTYNRVARWLFRKETPGFKAASLTAANKWTWLQDDATRRMRIHCDPVVLTRFDIVPNDNEGFSSTATPTLTLDSSRVFRNSNDFLRNKTTFSLSELDVQSKWQIRMVSVTMSDVRDMECIFQSVKLEFERTCCPPNYADYANLNLSKFGNWSQGPKGICWRLVSYWQQQTPLGTRLNKADLKHLH